MLLLFACASPDAPTWATAPAPDSVYHPAETVPAVEADAALVLNEAMAHNESTVMDASGAYPDWIELYAVADLDTTGWTLRDGDTTIVLPARTLQAGDHWLLWADGATDGTPDPDTGDDHLPLGLGDDDGLALFDPDGIEVDSWTLPTLGGDVAYGRFPDGGAMHRSTILATPGLPNPADPGMETDPSATLFPDEELLRIDLFLPEASITSLRSNAYAYVEGGIGFEGAWVSPVGVRIKGQAGSARSIDQKCAFHLGLDEYIDGGTLRGQEHLTLNNMVQDYSAIHERLTYTLFRAFDVPAPRVAHVELYVNGQYRGLYLNVESPDEQFLTRWFGSGDGNLYEGAYGPDLSDGSYAGLALDRDGDDVEPYTELAVLAALLAQTPGEDRVAELESLVDLDRALDMWAVEVVTGHWDGYFYYPNNYRIYHDPSTGLLTLLPWGVDQTWGWTGDPHGPAGDLAAWALQIPSVRTRFDLSLWAVSEAVETLDLATDARSTWIRIHDALDADPYKEYGIDTGEDYYRSTLDYLAYNPEYVLGTVFPDGAP